MRVDQQRRSSWREEWDDIERGLAGACLFGTPLVFTSDAWWRGALVAPLRMIFILSLTFAALVALNLTIGFRQRRGVGLTMALLDSAQAVAFGLLITSLVLLILGGLSLELGLQANIGRVVLQSMPFCLGIGLANGLLQHLEDDEEDSQPDQSAADAEQTDQSTWRGTWHNTGATALGATAFAFTIAPSQDIHLIANALTPGHLVAIVAMSLTLSYMIVFQAEFRRQKTRREHQGVFQSPVGETVFSYLLSLLLAVAGLVFFQVLRPDTPWQYWLTDSLVLGFPATIGAAAGRVAL